MFTQSCNLSDSDCVAFRSTISQVADKTFDLQFVLPTSGQIQIAWSGHIQSYVGSHPIICCSSPEPSTWAMLLIGFVGILMTHRRRAIMAPAPARLPSERMKYYR
ncbi:PEP-CTERM sorting domain-containing protein [Bradyrhizobium sp.]|uniref:PEP-CTERM sorting domain-containing protein n=1 Tax=Bradyrhizobium sp. TaxID=376 RepID=UPI0039C8A8D3